MGLPEKTSRIATRTALRSMLPPEILESPQQQRGVAGGVSSGSGHIIIFWGYRVRMSSGIAANSATWNISSGVVGHHHRLELRQNIASGVTAHNNRLGMGEHPS